MHVCSGKHIFSPSPLSAHWSIVIGLSVSGLVLSFVLGGFCRVTRGREREREKGDRERKKGKRESEGGRENGKDVCKSMSMADSSTKSPDIYSALLTNLKKKKKVFHPLCFFSIHSYSTFMEYACVRMCQNLYFQCIMMVTRARRIC